jgi:hypothetical protein
VNAAIARSLQERTEILWTLDRNAPDATSALCEAAINEASGRASDAQQVLRSAQGRVERETEELLSRHLAALESRGQALQATGLRLAMEEEIGHLAETITGSDLAASVASLVSSERRLDAIEGHWRGLQGLVAQVTTLSDEAADLGIGLDGVLSRLDSARSRLATLPATDQDLDAAAQIAAQTLMRLHEAIPPALEQELAQHGDRLEAAASGTGSPRAARRLHSEAVQHLKDGRLLDAVQSVRQLRAELERLAAETPPPAAEPASPGAVADGPPGASPAPAAIADNEPEAPPSDDGQRLVEAAMISQLTKKARGLAVRVRSLPANSETARAAAQQIQEATELLRGRRYAEADAALTRIMRLLAASESPR